MSCPGCPFKVGDDEWDSEEEDEEEDEAWKGNNNTFQEEMDQLKESYENVLKSGANNTQDALQAVEEKKKLEATQEVRIEIVKRGGAVA